MYISQNNASVYVKYARMNREELRRLKKACNDFIIDGYVMSITRGKSNQADICNDKFLSLNSSINGTIVTICRRLINKESKMM